MCFRRQIQRNGINRLIALRADAGSVQNQSVLADLDIFGKTVAADFNIVRLFSGEKFLMSSISFELFCFILFLPELLCLFQT